ncbi:uncharacterized protein J8A68_000704 [[Candida] subhashii]|uniref:Uncharacterized protein n=1 Tax=[Candida] subhashii TaxID=561895 RepID=A0A8J5QH75_9ASCO|nr:uncharacterized protein J8A68_000704 [[Candida] subhashii]KAG7665684.1 hypothetical protein J8A68_000704 [[Candida] subhashii]
MKKPFIDNLLDLPEDIIELIFAKIPDEYLHTYIDNPLIGTYALDTLFAKVTIDSPESGTTNVCRSTMHIPVRNDSVISKERLELNESVYPKRHFVPVLYVSHEFQFASIYQFLHFIEMYPSANPKIISFYNLNDVYATFKTYPYILKGADIQVLNLTSSMLEEEILCLPFKFQKLRYAGDCGYEVPYNVTEVEVMDLISVVPPEHYSNLRSLTIHEYVQVSELAYIPSNLQKLHIVMVLETEGCEILNLPISLQFLELGLIFQSPLGRCDLSHLTNLQSLRCMNEVPVGIINIPKSIADLSIYTQLPALDTFSKYRNLKSLFIKNRDGTIFNGIPFPQSLQVLSIDMIVMKFFEFINPIKVGREFLIPPNLTYLVIDGNVDFKLAEFEFPPSLHTLNLKGSPYSLSHRSRLEMPAHTTELTIARQNLIGLEFPQSLTSLNLEACELDSVTLSKFTSMTNLVSLSITGSDIGEFHSRFTASLKSLNLKDSGLLKFRIVAPNLKMLDLTGCKIESLDHTSFEIPDSVICLEIGGEILRQFYPEPDPKPRDFPFLVNNNRLNLRLPRSIKRLAGRFGYLTSKEVLSWNLQRSKYLTSVLLSDQKLTRLESLFPTTLRILDLSNNEITIPNSIFFKSFKKLEKLGIAYVGLDKYLSKLANIQFPDSLVEMDLRGNNLTNGSFRYLKLSNCKRLRFIALDKNPRCDPETILTELQEDCPLLIRLNNTALWEMETDSEYEFSD